MQINHQLYILTTSLCRSSRIAKVLLFIIAFFSFLFGTTFPATAQTGNSIVDLDWNAISTQFAAILDDGRVQIFDANTQQLILTLPDNGFLASIDWHPTDSNLLAISTFENGIRIIDVSTGNVVHQFAVNGNAYSVAFSPDGSMLAISTVSRNTGPSQEGWVEVIEVATGNRLLSSDEVSRLVISVQWSPDGRFIAGKNLGDFTHQIVVWDASTGAIVHNISEPVEDSKPAPDTTYVVGVDYLAWNPVFPQLAVASTLEISLFDTNSYELEAKSGAFDFYSIRDITWNPQGTLIALANGSDQNVAFLDMKTGQAVSRTSLDFDVRAVAWSPDGRKLACGGDVQLGQNPLPVIVPAHEFPDAKK